MVTAKRYDWPRAAVDNPIPSTSVVAGSANFHLPTPAGGSLRFSPVLNLDQDGADCCSARAEAIAEGGLPLPPASAGPTVRIERPTTRAR